MNPATAEAMQWRAFGSMLLHRSPALKSFVAAIPSQIVCWPEEKKPSPGLSPGSVLSRISSAFVAMRSYASSQEEGVWTPWWSNFPPFFRMRGFVSRSAPYWILARKYPLMQFRPRFTGAKRSPVVATIRPLRPDHHAASRPAEAADPLVPEDPRFGVRLAKVDLRFGRPGSGARGGQRRRNGCGFEEFTSRDHEVTSRGGGMRSLWMLRIAESLRTSRKRGEINRGYRLRVGNRSSQILIDEKPALRYELRHRSGRTPF